MSPVKLAAHLRDGRARGRSLPLKIWSALEWFDAAFGPSTLSLAKSLVSSQRDATRQEMKEGVKRAKPPSVEMLVQMENHLFNTDLNLILRLFAGLFFMMGIGCFRWSDVQRSKSLNLTPDAIMGVAWKLK